MSLSAFENNSEVGPPYDCLTDGQPVLAGEGTNDAPLSRGIPAELGLDAVAQAERMHGLIEHGRVPHQDPKPLAVARAIGRTVGGFVKRQDFPYTRDDAYESLEERRVRMDAMFVKFVNQVQDPPNETVEWLKTVIAGRDIPSVAIVWAALVARDRVSSAKYLDSRHNKQGFAVPHISRLRESVGSLLLRSDTAEFTDRSGYATLGSWMDRANRSIWNGPEYSSVAEQLIAATLVHPRPRHSLIINRHRQVGKLAYPKVPRPIVDTCIALQGSAAHTYGKKLPKGQPMVDLVPRAANEHSIYEKFRLLNLPPQVIDASEYWLITSLAPPLVSEGSYFIPRPIDHSQLYPGDVMDTIENSRYLHVLDHLGYTGSNY